MKKLLALVLCTVMAASLFTGCGGGAKEKGDAGGLPEARTKVAAGEPGWKADTDPVTLDWYVNYSWFNGMWDSGQFSQFIEKETGIKVNFIIPSGNESEKLNTMIAGDTLPDLITLEGSDPAVKEMVQAGLLYPLNDLADKYDPYFYEVTSEETMNWFAQEDGKTYGYPNGSISPEQYPEVHKDIYQTFNVKKDYYETIGSPDMSTPEGFLNALQAAQDMYKEQIDGFIPIAFHSFSDVGNYSFDSYLMDYLGIPKTINGKLYDRRENADYQEWLKTFRKANEMGLIAPNVFTDSRQQLEEEIAQRRVFALLYQNCDFMPEQQMFWNENPDTAYFAIQGPSTGTGPVLEGPSISGWTVTCVTKNCKDPERAIQFISYLLSEQGSIASYYGEEGVHYEIGEDGNPHFLPEWQEMYDNDYDAFNELTGQDPLWMLRDPVLEKNWNAQQPEYLAQMYSWGVPYAVSASQYSQLDPEPGSKEAEIKQDIDLLWGGTLPALITAASDEEFDALFQDFFAQRDAKGWEKLLAYQQTRYEENCKKLGIDE